MKALDCNGKTLPHRTYLAKHLSRYLPVLGQALKPYGQARPEQVLSWLGVVLPRRHQKAVKPLIWAVGRNPHCNQYHHDWHNMTVMVMAGILAELLPRTKRLTSDQKIALILAAMVHDLDHRGAYITSQPFAEENRSALIAGRRLYGRHGGAGHSWRRLSSLVKATSQHIANVDYQDDHMADILKDADLFGSLAFPHDIALSLTKGLKREQKIALPADKILYQFIGRMAEIGLSSPEGAEALKRSPLSSSAFRQYPLYAEKLIQHSPSYALAYALAFSKGKG